MSVRNYHARYRTAGDGRYHTAPCTALSALIVPELAHVREPNNHHGQTHRTGWYCARKVGRPLPFESGLERLRMMCLDFDPTVSTFAAQPFSLLWDEGGKTYCYTPDLLIVRLGQPRAVEDVKPLAFRNSRKNRPAFEAAREALEPVGLNFACWTPPGDIFAYNVRYLAGYRRTPVHLTEYLPPVLEAAASGPLPLAELARAAGPEAWTRPVIYHLLWTHRLHADLEQPLGHHTLIARAAS